MQIYVALYDKNFNVLIARKRTLTRWMGGRVSPRVYVVDEAGLACLPSGEKGRSETYVTAARRVFLDKTGFHIPVDHVATKAYQGNGYALVCMCVSGLKGLQETVNKGLAPLYHDSPAPANSAIVDWEFVSVQYVPRSNLDFVLAADVAPQNDLIAYETRRQTLLWYREMITVLKTVA